MQVIKDHDGAVYTLHLNDEIPKFRSGFRTIKVLHSGTKWVKLQCGRKTHRMLRDKWIELLIKALKKEAAQK